MDSFDGTGQFKPGKLKRLIKAQGNGCLADIANDRGSRYTDNPIEMRDALREYVNSPFGKSLLAIRSSSSQEEKGNWLVQ